MKKKVHYDTPKNKNNIAILGLGWLGEALARKMINNGVNVIGSTTSNKKLQLLSQSSLKVREIKVEAHAIFGDWSAFMKGVSILIINFPPKRIPNIETIYPNQIKQIIACTPKAVKVIFVSSTSVYGVSDNNNPIKEISNPKPVKASGRAILKAEQLLRNHFETQLTILRFSGLIGLERHPGKFLAGKQNIENPNAPVNLIHRDDCIGLIIAIINKNCFGEIINGCASVHPMRKLFYEKAAEVLNLKKPHFKASNTSIKTKIIDNSKSKILLDYAYKYDNPEDVF